MKNSALRDWVGRPPRSAADAPVGLLAPCKMLMSLFRQRDEGVPRGPGGPPHQAGFSPLSQGLPNGTRCAPLFSPKTAKHPIVLRGIAS